MNVLIIGLGSIGLKHVDALNKVCNVNIFALRSGLSSNNVLGVKNIFDISEAGVNFDFAIISNPTSSHKEAIMLLADLKCPLFIEKPLYHTLEIDEILEKIQSSHILTYVACNLRFLDCLQFVKNNVNLHRINEINCYCGSYLPGWRKTDFRETYSAMPEKGGGVHLDLIHEIDYIYWIFGKPKKTTSVLKNKSSLDIKSIDYANYCLEYERFCASVILNYYRRDYKRTFELVMEDATWAVDMAANTVTANGEIIFKSSQIMSDTYIPQMNYFINLVAEGETTSCNSVFDACEVLKICLNGK